MSAADRLAYHMQSYEVRGLGLHFLASSRYSAAQMAAQALGGAGAWAEETPDGRWQVLRPDGPGRHEPIGEPLVVEMPPPTSEPWWVKT